MKLLSRNQATKLVLLSKGGKKRALYIYFFDTKFIYSSLLYLKMRNSFLDWKSNCQIPCAHIKIVAGVPPPNKSWFTLRKLWPLDKNFQRPDNNKSKNNNNKKRNNRRYYILVGYVVGSSREQRCFSSAKKITRAQMPPVFYILHKLGSNNIYVYTSS